MEREGEIEAGTQVSDFNECRAEVTGVDRCAQEKTVFVRLADGTVLSLPFSLMRNSTQGYRFDGDFLGLSIAGSSASEPKLAHPAQSGEEIIPVMEEALHVETRSLETGAGVRVIKRVREDEETVDLPLFSQQYDVQRIARDDWVAEGETPCMREEADGTLVLPVLEEVLVVQKRVRLREEIRITRKRQENRAPQKVLLRREEVEVKNFGRKSE